MRYISKKENDKYIVSGIKEMETLDGDKVEVLFASKEYDKDKLVEALEAYKQERDLTIEKYNNDIQDLESILEAIGNN